MSRVSAGNWHQKSHAEIYQTAQGFNPNNPTTEQKPFINNAKDLQAETKKTVGEVQDLIGTDWKGEAATKMQHDCTKLFNDITAYSGDIEAFGAQLPALVSPIEAAKSIKEPMSQNEIDIKVANNQGAHRMTLADARAAVAQEVNKEQEDARNTMANQFSSPVVAAANKSMDDDGTGTGVDPNQQGGGQNNGGSNNASGQNKNSQNSDGQTKPAFNDGSGSQNGQGQGQGQGQGSGQGSGSGGQGSGSGGSGAGSGGSPFGSGAGGQGAGVSPYSPAYTPGSTTAAGYSPGTTTGTGAPGALRPGLGGIPGPGAGSGTNPAGVGASGIRGGAGGFGGMGMAGMGGAHARGQGEEEEDHEIPQILINIDNGNDLFGDLPKASPGVIGDWTEQERAEKQRSEAEKRRYKSLGWDVKFE